jgi:hypothetical protein
MSRAESLSLELDSVRLELEKLKAENAKLRIEKGVDVATPSEETEQLYQQAVSDLAQRDEEVARLRGNLDTVEEELRQLTAEMKVVKDRAELELHRTLAKERDKWEQREERLVQQLRELRSNSGTNVGDRESTPVQVDLSSAGGEDPEVEDGGLEEVEEPGVPAPTRRVTPQSVPPLSKFSGEDPNPGELFQEWKEQFELTADLLKWDDRAKLVNLVTRLRGQAYAFYRSCTVTQRGSYSKLVAALNARFTPVVIPAVQTSLFHDRKQGAQETVDSYAQDLRRLFLKAYPAVQQGSKEAEELGKSVLASQFVAGLRVDLKRKVAGQEGDIDSLIVKARFEDVKEKNFGKDRYAGISKSAPDQKSSTAQAVPTTTGQKQHDSRPRGQPRSGMSQVRCHSCGGFGHFARVCPMKSKGGTSEATGHKVAAVVPERSTPEPQKHWQEEVIDKELEEVFVTLHGVNITKQEGNVTLGETPVTDLDVEGTTVKALVDTGSPVSIVSSKFLFQALAKNRNCKHSCDEWTKEVKQRLHPTSV